MSLLQKIEIITKLKLKKYSKDYKLTELGLDSVKIAEVASILEEKLDRELSFKEMMEMTPKKLLLLIDEAEKKS